MDRKSKALFSLFLIVVSLSIAMAFYKTIVKGDFTVKTDIPVRE